MQVLAQKCVKKWPGKIHPKSRENPDQIFDRISKFQNLNFFRETSFWPNFEKNLLTVRCDLAEIAADIGKNLLQNDDQKSHSKCRFWLKNVSKNDQAKFIQNQGKTLSKFLIEFWNLKIWIFFAKRLFDQILEKIFWLSAAISPRSQRTTRIRSFISKILEKIFWPGQKIFSKIWSNQTFLIGFGQKIFFNFWAKFCSNVGSLDASQPGDWTNFGPILDTKSWKKSSDRVRRFFPRFGQIKNFGISKFQILEIQHFFNFWAKNHKNWIIKIFTRIPTLSGILVVRFDGQLSSPTRVQNDDQKWHNKCRFWPKKVSKNDQANSSKNEGQTTQKISKIWLAQNFQNPASPILDKNAQILKSQNFGQIFRFQDSLKFSSKITKIELSRFLQECRRYLAF